MKIIKLLIAIASLIIVSCNSGEKSDSAIMHRKDSLIDKINSPELLSVNAELIKSPDNAALYAKRAKLYISLKQYDEAVGDALRAVKIDSTKAEYYITLADVYFAFNKTRASKETLEFIVKKYPENTEAHLKLGELFFLVRQYESAIKEINSALKIDINIARAYYLKGCVFKEMGDTSKAISSMETAIEQDNKYFEAFVDLGLLYSVHKNPVAFQYFDNALRVKPNNEMVQYAKAKLLQDMSKIDECLLEYEKLLVINKNNTQVLYNMGAVYLDKKKELLKASDYFSKAISVDPKFTEAYFARGVCYEMMKDFSNAKADYNMCLQITPNYEGAIEALNNLKKAD